MNKNTLYGIFAALCLLTGVASAQDASCVNNADGNGNVCTNFTLAAPTVNCDTITSQDNNNISSGSMCPIQTYGSLAQGNVSLWLSNDPINPGMSLSLYSCVATLLSDTGNTPSAVNTTRSTVTSLSCPGIDEGWYAAVWNGTFTYNYSSLLKTSCSSGRGAHCVKNWVWVNKGGSGELNTLPPPPMPPPPPPTSYEIDLTFVPGPGLCDNNYTCYLVPTDTSQVQVGLLYLLGNALYIVNADGSMDVYDLTNNFSVTGVGDDGVPGAGSDDPYSVNINAYSFLYDPNTGSLLKTVNITVQVTTDGNGNVSLTSGTMSIIVQIPQVTQ